MKKLVLIMAFGLLSAIPAGAQDVFNQVVNNAKLVIDDPKAEPFILAVSRFKYTALQYLCTTAIKQNGGSVPADFLDVQAYNLNNFIISYFTELAKAQTASDSAQKEIMKRYWKACNANPMFENQDKETTDVFMTDPDCITPFSINTDWEKACAAAVKK